MPSYNLKDFVEKTEFSVSAKFPEGKTTLDLATATIEPVKFTDPDGKEKQRYKITANNVVYYAGPQIIQGIKVALEKGAKKVEIIRQGTDKNTKYIVLPA